MSEFGCVTGLVSGRVSGCPRASVLLNSVNLVVKFIVTCLLNNLVGSVPVMKKVLAFVACKFLKCLNVGVTLGDGSSLFGVDELSELSPSVGRGDAGGRKGAVPPGMLSADIVVSKEVTSVYGAKFVRKGLVVPGFMLSRLRRVTSSSSSLGEIEKEQNLSVLGVVRGRLSVRIRVDRTGFSSVPRISDGLLGLTRILNNGMIAGSCGLGGMTRFRNIRMLGVGRLTGTVGPITVPKRRVVIRIIGRKGRRDRNVTCLSSKAVVIMSKNGGRVKRAVEMLIASILRAPTKEVVFKGPGGWWVLEEISRGVGCFVLERLSLVWKL